MTRGANKRQKLADHQDHLITHHYYTVKLLIEASGLVLYIVLPFHGQMEGDSPVRVRYSRYRVRISICVYNVAIADPGYSGLTPTVH